MKKLLTQSAVATVGLAFASSAFAAKPDVRVAYKTMHLGGSSKTTMVGGTETGTVSEMGLRTFGSGLEIAFFVPGWAVYTYPAQGGASLAVGWAGITGLEVGPTLNFTTSSTENEPKGGTATTTSTASYTVGAYAYYALAAGSTNLELTLNPYFSMTSGETPAAAAGGSKTETSGSGIGVFFDLTVPFTLAEKFEYAPGVDLTYSSESSTSKSGGVEAPKDESSTLAWNLNFAKFRYTF